jgi:hypothetical protein
MSRSLTVTTSPDTISTSKAISAAARMAPLLILTARAYLDLAHELGSDKAAMRHLLRVSERVNRPVGCNFPTPEGSRTAFIAPRSWTQERLRGWVGGHYEDIADAFGPAVPLPLEDL